MEVSQFKSEINETESIKYETNSQEHATKSFFSVETMAFLKFK